MQCRAAPQSSSLKSSHTVLLGPVLNGGVPQADIEQGLLLPFYTCFPSPALLAVYLRGKRSILLHILI